MKKISLKFILLGVLASLFSLASFDLVAACDEAEMQTMITGAATGINNTNLGILSLIKELLIITTLILLIIYLIKLINKK